MWTVEDIIRQLSGRLDITFVGETMPRKLMIKRPVINSDLQVMYLIDQNDDIYGWNSIIKIKRSR